MRAEPVEAFKQIAHNKPFDWLRANGDTMKTIQYELKDGIATITFDEPGSPVNTMCRDWQHDLTEVTVQVVKDKDSIQGIVLA